MKTIHTLFGKAALLSIFAISVACGGSKACNEKLVSKECPADGKCTIVVHKDKSLLIKTDESGKPYYEMEDNTAKNVVIYTYNRDVPKDLQDGSYREEVVLELGKNQQSETLTGNAKGGVKALFGRFCYCKGSTGYYWIGSGNLTLSDADKQRYALEFKITEVPQVVTTIQFTTK